MFIFKSLIKMTSFRLVYILLGAGAQMKRISKAHLSSR